MLRLLICGFAQRVDDVVARTLAILNERTSLPECRYLGFRHRVRGPENLVLG
jgi:hypothetical protein